MLLAEYITVNGLTNKTFSEKLAVHMGGGNVSDRTVETWRHGRAIPRGAALQAIAAATDGKVTYADFVSNFKGRAQ